MSLREHMRKFAAHSELIDSHVDRFLANPPHDGDHGAAGKGVGHADLMHDAISASLRQAESDLHALSRGHHDGAPHPHHHADGKAHGSETADEQ